ncbi:MAG: helix-turn-helix domain-containing protein [Planctomycetota bacterium]|nr:helix-turn-helix domain-containing protein [Planctomycetota bacterium]
MSDREGTQPAREPENVEAEAERRAARKKRAEAVRRKYDFGVIRTLRQQKGLTIEKFAKLCGLSYAPISRIETNLIKPNLETLDKIAEGLGITTYNLVAMAERREARKMRSREYRSGGFTFQSVGFEGVEIYLGEGRRGAVANDPDLHTKDFATIVVRAGLLELRYHDKVFSIGPGEAVSFDCVFPHQYVAVEDTEIVVVLHSR